MADVLILGGTGTLGSALSQYLLENTDYKITVFTRHARENARPAERVRFVDGDATNPDDLAADDFTLSAKGEPARGYITTIPSIVRLIAQLLENPSLHVHESVSITKDMRSCSLP